MNKNKIITIIVILGILLLINTYMYKIDEDKYIEIISKQQGTCFLENGDCLHGERSHFNLFFEILISLLLFIIAIYLYFYNEEELNIAKENAKTSKIIAEIKEKDVTNTAFEAFLSTFNSDEKKILKAIKENEGVQQSTLRFKTDMSKATLSLILKSLEERNYIKKEPYKKTNKIYLIKKF
ncbi:hypothetical protein HOK68_02165 [Candidatus Woesearchaeota archaeon]|nr:hypothetical protein [Candidatus Woesearchaeota archaeon]MBT4387916.1 hypothetical protein [Candidatus Woesearchaeota archaeon]MBT4595734.1 hypothetical protein [Candidatus Woesearchaeota archaeon]MBT5741417.1 hypothetical protein [Candidatus Woesearchaeota archaeon]MBT6505559.1 hypothetical protein [Candidatus Woesearchaeota archaeon]